MDRGDTFQNPFFVQLTFIVSGSSLSVLSLVLRRDDQGPVP